MVDNKRNRDDISARAPAPAASDPSPAQPDLFDTDGLGLQILAVSPDCIKFLSRDGLIQSVNEAGRRLLEIEDASEVRGKRWPLGWPANARARAEEAIAGANKGHASRFTEFRPTAKGTPKCWDVVVSPLRRPDGAIERLLVIARDITLQKDYEDRVRRSEQQFRALADNIAQFAWLADPTGNVFWYNKRWFQYTGTTLEEMVGWGWQKVHHPDHVGRVVEKLSRHFASGEPWHDTFPLRAADGSYRWFLSQAMPIRNERGDITLWCGTNTDITEERRTSDRLRQKARLIELSHEAILVWDLAGGVVSWNRGCQELYGYTSDEALGKRTHDLLRTRHPMPAQEFEALLCRNRSWSGEIMHLAKDGSEVWVDSRQELIDLGERTLILETNRDITDRRRNDEMTQLLLGELDHRVKNTLAIVQSIASQTARRSSDLRAFTGRFNARLQALSRAHNLLTETRWSGANLGDLIRSQFADLGQSDRQVRLDGPPVFLPPQVALHLSLVIFELASNALTHGALSTPGGGIEVGWSVRPSVPERLELVWRERGGPQVAAPASRGFGTTLIERAGSQAHLQTRLRFMPEGVECRIEADITSPGSANPAYFNPRRQRSAVTPPAAQAGPAARPAVPRRVMIIEDEPLIALEMEELLIARGYAVVARAATVEEARSGLEREAPDIAVVDGSLLGEPVDAVIAKLSEKAIPFVVVTGFTREGLPPAVVASRVPVIHKPVQSDALLEAIQQVARAAQRD